MNNQPNNNDLYLLKHDNNIQIVLMKRIDSIEEDKFIDTEVNNITVTVNGEKVILSGKESYVFQY